MSARRQALSLLLAALLSGCALMGPQAPAEAPATAVPLTDAIVYSNTTWSGDLVIRRPVVVTRTATLTLLPGTRLFFEIPEPAPGKDRRPWILVQGGLVAIGNEDQPISFVSVRPAQNELDDVLQLESASETHLRFCNFEQGPWGVHVHDTALEVTECEFRRSYGGIRFQGGRVVVRNSRFVDNQIGVRCLKTSPVLEENTFQGNLTGIFFREGVTGAVLRRNNFHNREYDVKLGEGQVEDVDAAHNWWEVARGQGPGVRIFDREDGELLGRVRIDPPLPAPWEPPATRP